MTTQDYRFMLESAKEHLDERLTNKIRYLLNDIESALDYIAFAIFNQFCLKHITDSNKIKSAQKRVNFPLFDDKAYFDKKADKIFLDLRSEQPDIIVTGVDYWLPIFNMLVNNNKHRELEKQQRNKTTHIHHGQIGGVTFSNVKFVNCTTPISYNGTAIDFESPSPYDSNFLASTKIEFVFKDLNLSVIPTLKDIYTRTNKVISDLERIILN
ncbi:hypothetical protein ACFWMS_19875 [Peribacillus butanolivorans]|uniref:hypothetical protein n=1 Tax=Peribacillus butanolivorans TaxID=421767 RepID=UPI0036687DA5